MYDAVRPFQNGIRIGALEVVQDLVSMIADRAERFLFLSLFFRQIGIIFNQRTLEFFSKTFSLHLANLVHGFVGSLACPRHLYGLHAMFFALYAREIGMDIGWLFAV